MSSTNASEDDNDANFFDNVANTEEIDIDENVEIIEVTTLDIEEGAVETDTGTNEDSSSLVSELLDTESQMDLIDIPEEETLLDPPSFFPIRSSQLKQYTRRRSTPSVLVSDDCIMEELPTKEPLEVTPVDKEIVECLQATPLESSKSTLSLNKSTPLRKVVVEKICHLSTDEDSEAEGELMTGKDMLQTDKSSCNKPEAHAKVPTPCDASKQPMTDRNCDTAGDLDPQHSTLPSTSNEEKSDKSETAEPLTQTVDSCKQSESVIPINQTVQSFKHVKDSEPLRETEESCEQSKAVETFEQTVESCKTLEPSVQNHDGSETIQSPGIPENVKPSDLQGKENVVSNEEHRKQLELVSQSKLDSQIVEAHKSSIDEATALTNVAKSSEITNTTSSGLNKTNDDSYEDLDDSLVDNQALKTRITKKKSKKQLTLLRMKNLRLKKTGKKKEDKSVEIETISDTGNENSALLENKKSGQTSKDSSETLISKKACDKNMPSSSEKNRNSNVNKKMLSDNRAEETSKENAVSQPESIKEMVENNITMNDINIEIMYQQLIDREMSDEKEIYENTDNSQSNSENYVSEVAMPDVLDNTNEEIEASMLDNETEKNVTDKPETVSPRQRGRPRKYVKGQEPYRTPLKAKVSGKGRPVGRPRKNVQAMLKPSKHFPKPAKLHRGRPRKTAATKLSPPSPFSSPAKRGRPRKHPVGQTSPKCTYGSLYKMRKLKSALRECGDVSVLKMVEKESFKGFANTKESRLVSPQSVSVKTETDIDKPVTPEVDGLGETNNGTDEETLSPELPTEATTPKTANPTTTTTTEESVSINKIPKDVSANPTTTTTTEESVSIKKIPKDVSLSAQDRIDKVLVLLEADTIEALLHKVDGRKRLAQQASSSSLQLLQSLGGIRPLQEDAEVKEERQAPPPPVAKRPRGRPRKVNVFKLNVCGSKRDARKRLRRLQKTLSRVRGKKAQKDEEDVADVKQETTAGGDRVDSKPSEPSAAAAHPPEAAAAATQPPKRAKPPPPVFENNAEISAILDKHPDFRQFYAGRTLAAGKGGTHILGGKKKRRSAKDEERRFWSLWFEWKSLKPAEKKKYDASSDSLSSSSVASSAGGVVASSGGTYSRQFAKQRQAGLLLTGDSRICFLCLKGGRQEQLLRCKGRCQQTYHAECVRLVVRDPAHFSTPKKKRRGRKRLAGLPEGGGSSSVKRLKLEDGTAREVTSSVDSLAPPPTSNATPTSDTADSTSSEPSAQSTSSSTDMSASLKDSACTDLAVRGGGGGGDLAPVPDIDFLCHLCRAGGKQPCFICNDAATAAAGSPKVACRFPRCYKLYHEACLAANSSHCRWANGTLRSCPCHVCHMCASDTPGTALLGSHDKYLRCVRCPSTYHARMSCIPAGTRILGLKHALCPLHIARRHFVHFNTNWCFICSGGGQDGTQLLACARCPVAVHPACCVDDAAKYDEAHPYVCDDCKGGRLPLYGEVVWVRYGHFRWWPGQILFPEEIPDNLIARCAPGVFVVYFFGTHNYAHVCHGQTYVFEEGDERHTGGVAHAGGPRMRELDGSFLRSLGEARDAFEEFQRNRDRAKMEETGERAARPAPYVKIKTNKPVGAVRVETDKSSTPVCECDPASEAPCGFNSSCINRALYVECSPELCRSRARCQNQDFERRNYPPLEVFLTQSRGWGLRSAAALRKGQFVVEYVGEMIDQDELRRRRRDMEKNGEHNYYFLSLDNARYIDAGAKGNLARFMNHSCAPNCTAEKWTVAGDTRVGLFALRDIPAGAELAFNYELQKGERDDMRPCMCGAPACAGFIGAKKQEEKSAPAKETRKGVKAKRRHGRLGASQSAGRKLAVCSRCAQECGPSDSVTCALRRCRASYHTSCVAGLSRAVGGLIGTPETSIGTPAVLVGTPGSTVGPVDTSIRTSDTLNTPVSTRDPVTASGVVNDTPTTSKDMDVPTTSEDIIGTPSTTKDISGFATPSGVETSGDLMQGKWICPLHGCTTCKKTSRPTVKCKYCNGSYCKDHRNHLCYDISPSKVQHPSDPAPEGSDASLSLTEREKRTLRRNCGATSKEEIDNYLRIVNVRDELGAVRDLSETRRTSATKSRTPSSEDGTTSGASVTSGRESSAGCSSVEGGSVTETSGRGTEVSNEVSRGEADEGGRSSLKEGSEGRSVQENHEGSGDSNKRLKDKTADSVVFKNDEKTEDSASLCEFSGTGDLSQSEVDDLESDETLLLREDANGKRPPRRVRGRFVNVGLEKADENEIKEIVDEKVKKDVGSERKINKDSKCNQKLESGGVKVNIEVSTEIKDLTSEEPMDVDYNEDDLKESIHKVDESFEEARHENRLKESKKNVGDTCEEVVRSVRKSKRKSKLNIDKSDTLARNVDLSVLVAEAAENLKENSDANIASAESVKSKRSKRQVGIEKESVQHFLAAPSDTDNSVEGEWSEKYEKETGLDDMEDTGLSPEKIEKYLEEHNITDCNVSLDNLDVSADAVTPGVPFEQRVEENVLEVSSSSQSAKTRTRAQKQTESKEKDENNANAADDSQNEDKDNNSKSKDKNKKNSRNDALRKPDATCTVSSENVQKADEPVTTSQAKPKASVLKELRSLMIDMVEPANSEVINSVLEGNLSPSERPKRKSMRSKQNTEVEPKKDDIHSPKKGSVVKKTMDIFERDAEKLEEINNRKVANQALVLVSPLKAFVGKSKSTRNSLQSANAKETKPEEVPDTEVASELSTVGEPNARPTRKSTRRAEALESFSSANVEIGIENFDREKEVISEASTVSEPSTMPTRKSTRQAEIDNISLSSTRDPSTKTWETQEITQTLKKNGLTRSTGPSQDNSTSADGPGSTQTRRSLRQKISLEIQITDDENMDAQENKSLAQKTAEKVGKVVASEASENTDSKKKKVAVSLIGNDLEDNVENVLEKAKVNDVVDEMSNTRRKSSRIISSAAKNELKSVVPEEEDNAKGSREVTIEGADTSTSTEFDKNEQSTRSSQLDRNRMSKTSLPWIGEKKLLNISNDKVEDIHSTVITNRDVSNYICSVLNTADVSQNARNFAKSWGAKAIGISEKDVIRNLIEIMSILKTVSSDLSFLEFPVNETEMFKGFAIDQSPKVSLFRSKKLEKSESEFRQKLLQKYGSICKALDSEKLSSLEDIQNKYSTVEFSKERNLLEKRRSTRLSVDSRETESTGCEQENETPVQTTSKGEEKSVPINEEQVEVIDGILQSTTQQRIGTNQHRFGTTTNKELVQTNTDLLQCTQETIVDQTSKKVEEVSKPIDEQLKSGIANKVKETPVSDLIEKTVTNKSSKTKVMKVSEKGLVSASIGQILFSELKRKEMKQQGKALISEPTNDKLMKQPSKKVSVSEPAIKEQSETSKDILTNEPKEKSVGEFPQKEPTRELTKDTAKEKSVGEFPQKEPTRELTKDTAKEKTVGEFPQKEPTRESTKDTATSPSKDEIDNAELEAMMMNIHEESDTEKLTKINEGKDKLTTETNDDKSEAPEKKQTSPNVNNAKSVAEKVRDGETKPAGDPGEKEAHREKVKKRKISFSAEVMEKTRDQPEVKKRKVINEPSRVKTHSKEKELLHADEKENVLKKIMQEERRELERISEIKKQEAGVRNKLNDKKMKRKEAFRHEKKLLHEKKLKKFADRRDMKHGHEKKPQEHARAVENREKHIAKHKHDRQKSDEKSASLKANKDKLEKVPEKPSPSKKESHHRSHDTSKHKDKRKESEKPAHKDRPTVAPKPGEDKGAKDKNEKTPEKKNEKTSSEPSSREKSVSQPVGAEQKKSPVKPSDTKSSGPATATGPNPKKAGPMFFLEDLENSMANYYVDLAKKKKEKLAKKNQQIQSAKASAKPNSPPKSAERKLTPSNAPSGSSEKRATPEAAAPGGKRLKFSPESRPSASPGAPASCTVDLPPKKNLLKKYTFHHDVGADKPMHPSEPSKPRPGRVSNLCTLNATPPKLTAQPEVKPVDPRTASSTRSKSIPVSRWTPVATSESPAKVPAQVPAWSSPTSVTSDRKPSSHSESQSDKAKPKVRFSFMNYPFDVESSVNIPGQLVAKATLPANVNKTSSVSMTTETRSMPPTVNKAPLIDPSFFSPVKSHSNLSSQKSPLPSPLNPTSLKSHSDLMLHLEIPQRSRESVSDPLTNSKLAQKSCVENPTEVSSGNPIVTLGNPTKSAQFDPLPRQGTKIPNLQTLCSQEFHTLSPVNEKSSLCSIM